PGARTETLTEALQGLLTGSGIAGLVVGLLLASVPLVWLLLRRGQRSNGPSRRRDAAATNRRNLAIGDGALLRRKNGQFRPVEYRIVPVTEQGATVGTVLVFHDVGERVRLDNLLKDMQTTARIGGWEYDVDTHKVHWTEALYSIHDLPFGQTIELESSRNMFHPEDKKKLIEASQHAIDTGASSDLHLRLTSARGRQLWVRMIIKAERRNGKIVRLHGTLQDVTDRVVAERQLRETRDFFELTLNAVPTPINYFNRDFVMTYSNRAFEEWLGVPATKMIGKGLRELLTTDMFTVDMPYVDKVMAGERVHSRHTAMRHGIMREWQNHYVA